MQSSSCSLSAAFPNTYKYTGKERDSESGLDNFGARYNASSMGRFMTPDWAAKPVTVPYAHFGNPQSLNLYSYVQNNPTTTGDPDGHCPSDNPNCKNVTVQAGLRETSCSAERDDQRHKRESRGEGNWSRGTAR